MTLVLIILGLAIAAGVAWAVSAAVARRNDPLLRVARARANHGIQLHLFQERSRFRAAEAERAAKRAMNARRSAH